MKEQPNQPRVIVFLVALTLTSCGRGQTRDQADFWQEALPDPIAVLDPWLSKPTSARVVDEQWPARIIEIGAYVEGPEDTTGAQQTVLLRDASARERRLYVRLAPGALLPLFRNEAVKIRTFSRLTEQGEVQRAVIVLARRPLGTGADFKPVVIVSPYDDLIPADALPHVLNGMTRTEQLAYREARKGAGECTLETSHYLVNAGLDARTASTVSRRRPAYPPGARLRREEGDSAYDVVLYDARRTSVAPCPMPDETALVWSATWASVPTGKLSVKSTSSAQELLPQPATPTAGPVPGVPVRKGRKTPQAPKP